MSGLARTGEVLSCYAARKYPKKRTLLTGPAGCPHSSPPSRPGRKLASLCFAQTAVPDCPGSTNLRSAVQKGRRTLRVRPSPQPSPFRGEGDNQTVDGKVVCFSIPFWLAEWKGINTGKSGFVCLSEASLEVGRIDALERRHRRSRRDRGYASLVSFLSYNKKELACRGETRHWRLVCQETKRTQPLARTACLGRQATTTSSCVSIYGAPMRSRQ